MKANPTEAKDIALYFLDAIGTERYTSPVIARNVRQAKLILEAGYTKEEVIDTIDRIIMKGVQMYSLGYVSSAINDVLKEIEEKRLEEDSKRVREELEKQNAESRKAVESDGETAQRNRDKARNFGAKSRKRTESYIDMLKE